MVVLLMAGRCEPSLSSWQPLLRENNGHWIARISAQSAAAAAAGWLERRSPPPISKPAGYVGSR